MKAGRKSPEVRTSEPMEIETKCGRQTGDEIFEFIAKNIEDGLPVILGWETEDYGCHAVLVIGYWLGNETWLTIHDPGGLTEISCNSLTDQQRGNGQFD